MSDYTKVVQGSSTFSDGNMLKVDKASITVKESSTAVFAGLTCAGDLVISCEGSFIFGSTLVIDQLICGNATISVTTSSTVDIKNIQSSGTVTLHVKDSSTVRIRDGSMNVVTGEIASASTGVCRATINRDDVQTSGASTWDAALAASSSASRPVTA
jgi:hypothetical protein